MRFLTAAFSLLFFFAGTCSAGELLKDLPERAPEHTLIELSGQEGTSWAWIIKRLPDGFRPRVRMVDDGRTAIWTGPPGDYDVDVIALRDGALIQDFARFTIEATSPPRPQPDPEPDRPPGPQPTDLSRQVAGWARAVADPSGAQALALVHRQVADAAGEMTLEQAIQSLRTGSDRALVETGTINQWAEFRRKTGQSLAEHRQRGQVVTSEHFAAWMNEIAQGLELAADGSQALPLRTVINVAALVNAAIEEARQ